MLNKFELVLNFLVLDFLIFSFLIETRGYARVNTTCWDPKGHKGYQVPTDE